MVPRLRTPSPGPSPKPPPSRPMGQERLVFGHTVMLARCWPVVNAHFKAGAAWLQAVVPNATRSMGRPTRGYRGFRSVDTGFPQVVLRTVEVES
jgi:hypothetical protein